MSARAAIFDSAGEPFRIEELPVPRHLKAGEVLVEISLATICGSDLHTHAGRRQEPVPCVLGHEGEALVGADVPGRSADVVIEAAGVPAIVNEGLRMLRPGGHYLFAGMVHPDSALHITGEAIIRGCVSLRGFHNYAPHHLDQALAFLSGSFLPWASLVSPPLPLEQLEEGFALSATRRWARVAVTMCH